MVQLFVHLCFSLRVSPPCSPESKGSGLFFIVHVKRLTLVFLNFYSGVGGLVLALWGLVFILRGWGLRFGKFGLRLWNSVYTRTVGGAQ